MKLLAKSHLLKQPHMVAEKNISDGPESGPQREETVLCVVVIQLQQQFGSKMLNAPKIKVTALVICVYNKVLELYSDHQQCGIVPCPNSQLLSQQPLDQHPDLNEENILSTPQQCETSHAAGANAVFPMVLLLSQGAAAVCHSHFQFLRTAGKASATHQSWAKTLLPAAWTCRELHCRSW